MFTGIINDIGRITAYQQQGEGVRLSIDCHYQAETIDIGASIACGGPCLTVVDRTQKEPDICSFEVDVSKETLHLTTLGEAKVGDELNLERAMSPSSEFGGHMVTGHIDQKIPVVEVMEEGGYIRYQLEAPPELARFIADKGSVCLDGTSLTVVNVDGVRFSIFLIPHTLDVTTWKNRKVGDLVNLEVDLMARYAARLAELKP